MKWCCFKVWWRTIFVSVASSFTFSYNSVWKTKRCC